MLTVSKKYKGKRIAELQKIVSELSDVCVSAGVLGGSYPTDTAIATVAFFLEYGTVRIYPRYFFVKAIDSHREELRRFNQALALQINNGEISQTNAAKKMGQRLVEIIKSQIVSQGLIKTGRLLNSIDYRIDNDVVV